MRDDPKAISIDPLAPFAARSSFAFAASLFSDGPFDIHRGSFSFTAGMSGFGRREAGVGILLLTTSGLTIGNVAGLLNSLFTCLASGLVAAVAAAPAGADVPVAVAAGIAAPVGVG